MKFKIISALVLLSTTGIVLTSCGGDEPTSSEEEIYQIAFHGMDDGGWFTLGLEKGEIITAEDAKIDLELGVDGVLYGWYDNIEREGEMISFPYTVTGDIDLYYVKAKVLDRTNFVTSIHNLDSIDYTLFESYNGSAIEESIVTINGEDKDVILDEELFKAEDFTNIKTIEIKRSVEVFKIGTFDLLSDEHVVIYESDNYTTNSGVEMKLVGFSHYSNLAGTPEYANITEVLDSNRSSSSYVFPVWRNA